MTRERPVFTLYNTIITINEGVKLLRTRARELKHHIFVAYNQWEYKISVSQTYS